MTTTSSRKPQPKVAAGGATAAGATVLIWAAGLFGVDMPPEVAAAVVSVVSFAAAYLFGGYEGRHGAGS